MALFVKYVPTGLSPGGGGGGGGGNVSSVGLSDDSSLPIYSISGSPVTTTGTLSFSLVAQDANTVFAGPPSGAADEPGFRALTSDDLPFAIGNLTTAGTDGLVVTGGTGVVIGSGTSLAQHVADSTHNGYLSSTDWTTFNNKQPTLTLGNITDSGTDGIIVTGGTNAIIGSGVALAQHVADSTHNGYLSSVDWIAFNAKQSALALTNLTDAGTDGIVVTNGTGAVIGASPVTLAQHVADSTHNGYLSSTDWSTFNGKQDTVTIGNFNGTSTAKGLDITASVVSLHAADATNPGAVSTTTQTFAGVKTFSSAPIISALTASQAVVTDGSKALASLAYTAAATASTIASRDSSGNTRVNSIIDNFATTATAAGTTTLTVASAKTQQFTGTTTQTVVLPDATTLVAGQQFNITNRSMGIVTVNANGGGLIQTMVGSSQAVITAVTVATSAGTWDSQYTVTGVVAAVNPTIQKFTSGTAQTYTKPSGVQYISIRMVGGGGGGGGAGVGGANGGNGGATTWDTTVLAANGGEGGKTSGDKASGGTASIGTGPVGIAFSGTQGSVCGGNLAASSGGQGGSSYFGGGGAGAPGNASGGQAGATNTGSGGGGAGVAAGSGAGGGGSGGYVEAIITSPNATYTYSVGTAGTAGAGAQTGGAGGAGYIEVTEYYTNFSVGTTAAVSANTVLAGPTSGGTAAPTFRALVNADVSSVGATTRISGAISSTTAASTLVFPTTDFNVGSNTVSGGRITIAAGMGGYYQASVDVNAANANIGYRVYVNAVAGQYLAYSNSIGWVSGSMPIAVSAGDIVDLRPDGTTGAIAATGSAFGLSKILGV